MLRCSRLKGFAALATGMLLGSGASAQLVAVKATSGLRHESMQDYRGHLAAVQALVQACGAAGAACDPTKVGDDERVDAPDTSAKVFEVRWLWLREDVKEAKEANAERRGQLMREASARIDGMVRESGQPVVAPAAQFGVARKDVDRILAGSEFATVEQQSWLDRQVAKFWLWWGRFWDGLGNMGGVGPWLGHLLEWLFFGGSAVGLALFVRRNLQRQRLAVALNSQAGELAWARESTDWAAQAEASARKGDWRDAVHCLYWATIVMLEGRRAWRHNPARTPREYVRLLKPGSAQQGALRGLTQIFERLWYGLRAASPADYERARSLYESLRDHAAASGASAGAA
jgi:Domain of unknown function (DUF4129)